MASVSSVGSSLMAFGLLYYTRKVYFGDFRIRILVAKKKEECARFIIALIATFLFLLLEEEEEEEEEE